MKNRLTRIKSTIRKKIRNTSPLKYIMRNISPPPPKYPPPPNVNIADQIPLQVKIRNTRFRSDLVGKFQR